jgi:hypothetical protein
MRFLEKCGTKNKPNFLASKIIVNRKRSYKIVNCLKDEKEGS